MNKAYTLNELAKMAYYNQEDYKIIRTSDQNDLTKSFWFSVHSNIKTKIFSVEDVNSYWVIVDTSNKYKVEFPYGEKS